MAFVENDLISQLPSLVWRGLTAPCDIGAFQVSHRQVPRAYPYVDGEGHDNTGRPSIPVPATLYFLDSLLDDPFAGWNAWLVELLDARSGDLQHPLLGPIRARVLDFRPNISARVRNGFAVDVTWIETIDDPTQSTIFALLADSEGGGLAAQATAADEAAAAFGISFPGGVSSTGAVNVELLPKLPNGSPVLSLSEAIAALKGNVFATEVSLRAFANRVLGLTATMVGVAEKLTDPRAWAAVDLLQQVWLGVKDIADAAQRLSPRPLGRKTLRADTTLERFASEVGNTISEIAQLNPFALRTQIIERGKTLTYYTV